MRYTNVEDPSPKSEMERIVTGTVSFVLVVIFLGFSFFFWSAQIENFQQTVIEGRMSVFANQESGRFRPQGLIARPESIASGQ
jgi:hypothetical protein